LPAWRPESSLRTYVLSLMASAWSLEGLGRWEEGIAVGAEALKIAEEHMDSSQISYAASIMAFAYLSKGDLDKAFKYLDLGSQKESPVDRGVKQIAQGLAWARAGETTRAVKALKDCLSLLQTGTHRTLELMCLCYLGESYVLAGDFGKAKHL
jgi:tetratricopeptide (TPR) repeat protein